MKQTNAVLAVLSVLAACLLTPVSSLPSSAEQLQQSPTDRDARFLRAALLTIAPEVCLTTAGPAHPSGYCYTSRDCATYGGVGAGGCANDLGTCCYFLRSCSNTTLTNVTSFVNPLHPLADTTPKSCPLTVALVSSNICQLRLDFLSLELQGPSRQGVCDTDHLVVTGSTSDGKLPKICGTNSGQHMYVDVAPGGPDPTITITTGPGDFSRNWNILITQIECTSTSRAPAGCLQYFTEPKGVVQSFNYRKPTAAEISGETGPVHLADLDYSSCLAPQPNTCSVTWSSDPAKLPYAFMMSGDANGGSTDALFSSDCTNDFVSLANAKVTVGVDDPVSHDKICGLSFPDSVTTSSLPYQLRVMTDDSETGDVSNFGFSLQYEHIAC